MSSPRGEPPSRTSSRLSGSIASTSRCSQSVPLANVDERDDWRVHFADTLRGGQYLNNWRMAQLHAKEAADRVRDAFDRYQRNYEIVVRRAQAAGEIGADKDARALARFLTSSAHGLHAMAKANPDREVLEDVARTVLAALD